MTNKYHIRAFYANSYNLCYNINSDIYKLLFNCYTMNLSKESRFVYALTKRFDYILRTGYYIHKNIFKHEQNDELYNTLDALLYNNVDISPLKHCTTLVITTET